MRTANKEDQPPKQEETLVAIAISDLHLSHKPPVARSEEVNWYRTQASYLNQIKRLAGQGGFFPSNIPILCPGDIFDDGWRPHKCPPELVNFAIRNLPDNIYAVPGQHDLPHHRYEDIKKSAFWTLMEAGKIKLVDPENPVVLEEFSIRLHGLPWSFEITPLRDPCDFYLEIALIHSYLWIDGKSYPGAQEEKKLGATRKNLKGYDVCLFGDNHIPFMVTRDNQTIVNCGSLLRRSIDQINHKPCAYKIYSTGRVEKHFLDTTKDRLIDTRKHHNVENIDISKFLDDLRDIKEHSISFEEAVFRYLENKKISEEVKRIIIYSLE